MFYIDLDMRWKIVISKKKLNSLRLFSALLVACMFMPVDTIAQSNESNKSKKQTTYKKARVLQTATAKKITKVTEASVTFVIFLAVAVWRTLAFLYVVCFLDLFDSLD